MKENPFETLIVEFERMEKEGVVDLSVLIDIENAIEDSSQKEKYWIHSEKNVNETFMMFHAARNNRLVTEKLKRRLQLAEEKKR